MAIWLVNMVLLIYDRELHHFLLSLLTAEGSVFLHEDLVLALLMWILQHIKNSQARSKLMCK